MPLPPGRLTLPLSAEGLVRVRAAIETGDGGFRFVQLPARQPGGRLLGYSFDVTGHGLEREAVTGEGAHPLGNVTLTLRAPQVDGKPLPVDYSAWKGRGLSATAGGSSARLKFLATSDLQPAFRIRQPLDGKAVPVIVSPAVAAAAGADRLRSAADRGHAAAHARRRDREPLPLGRRRPRGRRPGDVRDRHERRPSRHRGHQRDLAGQGAAVRRAVRRRPGEDACRACRRGSPTTHSPAARCSRSSSPRWPAIGLALAGLLLVVVADLRDERGELFDLEAQGATPDTLRRHLRLRALMLVGMGLVGGIVTGAVLSALVVSLVEVTANATAPQPPLELSVDWSVLGLGLLAYAAAAALLVSAVTWNAFRAPAAGRFSEVGW